MPDIDAITELIRAEANEVLRPSTVVDVERAMADGGRRRSRRRMMRLTAVACAVVVVVGGVTAVIVPGRRSSIPPPAATASPTPTVAVERVDRFDPLRQRLRLGWVPPGDGEYLMESSPTVQRISYGYPFGYDPPGGLFLVELFPVMPVAAGLEVDSSARHLGIAEGSAPSGEPGPPVNGVASIWVADPPGDAALAFQWAPGAWAVVSGRTGTVVGASKARLEQTLHRIASQLRTDVATPIALPFTMTAPGGGLRVGRTLVARYTGGGYEGQLLFTNAEGEWNRAGLPVGVSISVMKDNSTGDAKGGFANTILHGHPAQVDFTGESGRVDLFQVDGHRISVLVYEIADMGVDKQEAVDIALGIQLVPEPARQSTWTDQPLR
jgi:hypothetical protein